jgi:hypothetical protein
MQRYMHARRHVCVSALPIVGDASRCTTRRVRFPSCALPAAGQVLRIIAAVADACGWSTTSTSKVVWAELRFVTSPHQRSEPTVTPL